MKTKEALQVILDLATQNALDDYFKNDNELKGEYQRQQQAINKIETLISNFPVYANETYVMEKTAEKFRRIFNSD